MLIMEASYCDLIADPVVTMDHLDSQMMKESDLCNHRDLTNFIYPLNSRIMFKELPHNNKVKSHYDVRKSLLMLEEIAEDDVSWTDEETKSFLKFEHHAACDCAYFLERKLHDEFGQASVRVNDPFVLFLTDFAVATFNELCRKHFKKSVHDNIYGAVATRATYYPNRFGYIFFLTIEAMEEDVAGMYEAKVFINRFERRRTLIKFVRSPCAPLGSKFKERNDLIYLYEAVNDKQKAIEAEICSPRKGYSLLLFFFLPYFLLDASSYRLQNGLDGLDPWHALVKFIFTRKKRFLPKSVRLQRFYSAVKGRKRSIASVRFLSLKKKYRTMEGARLIVERHAHLLKQKSWEIKRSNSEDWLVSNQTCGLLPRSAEHSCGGYDYHNPLKVLYTEVLESILNSSSPPNGLLERIY